MRFAKRCPQFIMFDIGAKPSRLDMDVTAIRVLAKQPAGLFGSFGQQVNSAVDANRQHVIFGR